MRRVSSTRRTAALPSARAVSEPQPVAAPATRRPAVSVKGGLNMLLLAVLFWVIFYQNLPYNFGLNRDLPVGGDAPVLTPQAAGGEVSTGNTVDRVLKLCMLSMSAFVILRRWPLARSTLKHVNVGFAVVAVLIPLSALWSIEQSETILRSVTLLIIVLLCFAVSITGWDRRRFQQLVVPPLMYIFVASLVLGAIYPTRMMETGDDLSLKDAWHGITMTKNQFGMAASLGILIFANRWLAREGRMLWSVGGTLISLTCLVLSRSNTSMFATLLCMVVMVGLLRVPAFKRPRAAAIAVASIVGIIVIYELVIQDLIPGAYTLLAPVRELTGKDATFSARTIIWDVIKQHIRQAPLLGSGYAAYWVPSPLPSSPSFVFTWMMFFYPTEAHNGYLDIVNDLGYLGLGCLAAFLVFYLRQALQLMQTDRSQGALYVALMVQQMVLNMSESEWFARDSVFAIMILSTMCLSRALREAQLQVTPAAPPVIQKPAQTRGRRVIARARF